MKHLKLKQNSNTEIVTSAIIEKLYKLVSNNTLDSSSSLSGNLQSPHAYEDAVSYLTSNYPNLAINITNGNYIRFKDSAVETICKNNWGDSIGITDAQATSVINMNLKFKNNTDIVNFDEFKRFTGIKTLKDEFMNCTSLKSISVENLTILSVTMFQGCTSLNNIKGLDKITSIDIATFQSCTSLSGIIDLSNLLKVNTQAFNGCTNLNGVILSDKCTEIGISAFSNCKKLTSLGDLSNVITINSNAFSNCASLQSVDNLSSLINLSGFINCTSLQSVGNLPSVINVGTAFSGDILLNDITLSSACTTIGQEAFMNCSALQSLGDTSGITSIATRSFYNCTALKSLDLSNIISINDSAFQNCKLLTSIGNTTKLNSIESLAFKDCISLQLIDVSNIQNFKAACFLNCNSLKSFTFNDNVQIVDSNAFDGTAWLDLQDSGIIKIGKVIYKYKGTIPSGYVVDTTDIVYITSYAFKGQSNLTSITLNNNITKINYQTFRDCSLDYIILPAVTSLDSGAFYNCNKLRYVKISTSSVAALASVDAFYNVTCNFYVPDTLVDSYKAATNWSSLASRIFSMTQFATDFPN